jgi:hypothetical protein
MTLQYTTEPENGLRWVHCGRCDFKRLTHWPIEQIHHVCHKGPCASLGKKEVRRQLCEGCKGKVQIKIMDCKVHGECTPKKKLDGVACCTTCKDYSERAAVV